MKFQILAGNNHLSFHVGLLQQKFQLYKILNISPDIHSTVKRFVHVDKCLFRISDYRVCFFFFPLSKHVDLSPGELLFYAGVEWLNISEFLGKIKKGLELYAMCFVFKTAVVFLCKEKIRQKKKLMVSRFFFNKDIS